MTSAIKPVKGMSESKKPIWVLVNLSSLRKRTKAGPKKVNWA
jgi:hypothetical protein